MCLHYRVKLEMLIGHVLSIELLQEETPEFIPPQLWPSNLPDLNPVDYNIWRVLEEKVYKIGIIDLNKLK